jgi:hypothetical protein
MAVESCSLVLRCFPKLEDPHAQVLSMLYLWLKAGHVIFVIFWMAGLFMLPRLFVYHRETPVNSPENAVGPIASAS